MSARHLRTVAVLGLTCVVAASGVADAARKPKPKPIPPVCNLITDPAGNAYAFDPGSPVPPQGATDELDVLSADVATDGKNLTTVIRVKKAGTSSTTAPTGMQWQFGFTNQGVIFSTSVSSSPTGGLTGIWAVRTTASNTISGTVTPVIDTTANEIRATVPLADLAAKASFVPGHKLESLTVTTAGAVIVPDPSGHTLTKYGTLATLQNPVSGQSITGSRDYIIGSPSCVAVGK
ncbi:MAG: hypothetical protein M3N21_02430 [Actinomycetota bacterium]|nr:hypothetical protein [Actinomycetota bacterium]